MPSRRPLQCSETRPGQFPAGGTAPTASAVLYLSDATNPRIAYGEGLMGTFTRKSESDCNVNNRLVWALRTRISKSETMKTNAVIQNYNEPV
ncbi:hypothetical protein MGN70_005122 [Eutypa lata]|nr:hypothetical protein MGN70_005122 [Eutypa lata]